MPPFLHSGAHATDKPQPKSFLFLQGHPSQFARKLATALEEAGHKTLRVNFCVGDALYWLGKPAINFRGSISAWPEFLTHLIRKQHITDVLYYGDCRPYHLIAAEIAEKLGINAYAYEFGYLRPDWLTLEHNGMGARSHFPNEPDLIRAIGARFPHPDLRPRYTHSQARELANELFYHLSTYFLHVLYPKYDADRYYNPVIEYLTGIPKQLASKRRGAEAKQIVSRLCREPTSFFLFPLQLQCDYQLRRNAPFFHQRDAIRQAIYSFARHAPSSSKLLFKCHPLDNGGEHWDRHIAQASREAAVIDRVSYVEGGDLEKLLQYARGVVLTNSTVGMHALIQGCPVKVLGCAVFDIEGLAHRGSLDSFWGNPTKPDPELTNALVRALAGTVQVKGSFFDPIGRADAIKVFVERLTRGTVNSSGAYVKPAPRRQTVRSPNQDC